MMVLRCMRSVYNLPDKLFACCGAHGARINAVALCTSGVFSAVGSGYGISKYFFSGSEEVTLSSNILTLVSTLLMIITCCGACVIGKRLVYLEGLYENGRLVNLEIGKLDSTVRTYGTHADRFRQKADQFGEHAKGVTTAYTKLTDGLEQALRDLDAVEVTTQLSTAQLKEVASQLSANNGLSLEALKKIEQLIPQLQGLTDEWKELREQEAERTKQQMQRSTVALESSSSTLTAADSANRKLEEFLDQ